MTGTPGYTEQPVGTFLDGLAAGTAAPAGGSAAALTVALAAALCAKTARLSARQLTAKRAGQLTASAERIRNVAGSLIDADALAYRGVIEQTRRAASPGVCQDWVDFSGLSPEESTRSAGCAGNAGPLAAALSAAAEVPMQVVELAADVAELAATLAASGKPALRGDAITAALLAESGARAAATLVAINLAAAADDPRHAHAALVLSRIASLVGRATAAAGHAV